MKKLILVVMAFGTLTAFAQDVETAVDEVTTEVVASQDEFSEIEASELPAAVTDAVATNYPSATIDKAYTNEAGQFKLEVSLEDGTNGTLYADAEGNWIEL